MILNRKTLILAVLLGIYYAIGSTYFIDIANENDTAILIKFFVFAITTPLWYYLLQFIKNKTCSKSTEPITKKELVLYGFLILSVLLVYLFAFYPGGASNDTYNQWAQVQSGNYTNWHPVLHTILFLKLPSLFYNELVSATMFQILFITSIMIYMCYVLRKLEVSKILMIIGLLFIIANPSFGKMGVMLWKDIPYSYMILLATLILFQVVASKGEYLKKRSGLILLIISSLGILFFRHNGIIAYAGMMVCLFVCYSNYRIRTAITAVAILIFYFLVVYIGFPLLNISNSTGGFSEMLGVPLNQMAYIYHYADEIKEDDLSFLDQIAPIEDWDTYYVLADYNRIKWNSNFNRSFLEQHQSEFFQTWWSMITSHFGLAVKSYYHTSASVWRLDAVYEGVYYYENSAYTRLKKVSYLTNTVIMDYEQWVSTTPIGKLVFSFGGALFIIMISLFMVFNKYQVKLNYLLPYIPVFLNTITILLLITGGEIRFVYSNIVCSIPLVLYAFLERSELDETVV